MHWPQRQTGVESGGPGRKEPPGPPNEAIATWRASVGSSSHLLWDVEQISRAQSPTCDLSGAEDHDPQGQFHLGPATWQRRKGRQRGVQGLFLRLWGQRRWPPDILWPRPLPGSFRTLLQDNLLPEGGNLLPSSAGEPI